MISALRHPITGGDNGKLVIDEDVLKSMAPPTLMPYASCLQTGTRGWEPACRMLLRTQPMSAASPGTMCAYAGTKDVLTTSNTLYEEMKHISRDTFQSEYQVSVGKDTVLECSLMPWNRPYRI